MTRSYVLVPVSQSAFDEVKAVLLQAGYSRVFAQSNGSTVIDMHGLALVVSVPVVTTRTIPNETDANGL